jgi:hypothetical protein
LEEVEDLVGPLAVVGQGGVGLVLLAPRSVVEGVVRVAEVELDCMGLAVGPWGGDKVVLGVGKGDVDPGSVPVEGLVIGRRVAAAEAGTVDGRVADDLGPCARSSSGTRVCIDADAPLPPCTSSIKLGKCCRGRRQLLVEAHHEAT